MSTARPCAGASVVASRFVPVTPGQEVVDDKVGHCAAEAFTGILIRAEMLARVDPAETSLVLNGREVVEGADDPGEHFRSDVHMKRLVAEQGVQDSRGAGAA
jgi:hypothetical protein